MNYSGVAFLCRANVSIEHEVQDMVTHTIILFGKIDFLVNNASITSQIPMNELDKVTGEVWDFLFAINVKDMFNCMKAVVPHMKRQSAGAIVNLRSVAGVNGIGSSIPYAATRSTIHTINVHLPSHSHLTFALIVSLRKLSPRVDGLGMRIGCMV